MRSLVRRRFVHLKVLRKTEKRKYGQYYLCECVCGTQKEIRGSYLTSGVQKSCGCMRGRTEDLVGKKFTRLRVLKRDGDKWLCRCVCGKDHRVSHCDLTSKAVQSCGCFRRDQSKKRATRHGYRGSRTRNADRRPEYYVWSSMIQRCTNPKDPAWKHYGGRGITVCKRWQGKNGFKNFIADMGDRPSSHHSIDRTNNDRGYKPSNCEWEKRKPQMRNRRNTVRFRHNGKVQTAVEWAEELGINYWTIMDRRKRGWSTPDILTPCE